MDIHQLRTFVTVARTGLTRPAHLAFGVAPLPCELLVGTELDTLQIVDVGIGGADVPWN